MTMITIPIPLENTPAPSMLAKEHRTDDHVIRLWLGRFESPNTKRIYRRAASRFLAHVGGIRSATLDDLQAFAQNLTGKPATRALTLAAVKSLLSFAHRIGYTPFNAGGAVSLPKIKNELAERILDEADTLRMIELTPPGRNHVLMRILYATGGRVSEITGLCWRDVQPRDQGRGQVVLYGKGGKTRTVVIERPKTFAMLQALRGDAGDDASVFVSRQGGCLSVMQVERIVKQAATRAGITGNVSPHWMRHAHASHAIDNGATPVEVQATLGHASLATTSKYTHARPGHSSGRVLKV